MSSPARLSARIPKADASSTSRGHGRGDEVAVVTLTSDRELLQAVQSAMGDSRRVLHAESPDAAVDLLLVGHCGVMLADLAVLATDFTDLLRHLREQFPDLVIVAAGGRADERRAATLLSEGELYRFLHKPASPARARLFIEASVRRHLQKREDPARPIARRLDSLGRRGAGRWPLVVGALLAVVLIAYLSLGGGEDSPPAARATTSASAATTGPAVPASQEVTAVLERARQALRSGRYFEPADDNVIDLYRAVLTLQPNEPEAMDGLRRVAELLLSQAEQALVKDDPIRARRLLDAVRRAQPNHPRLAFLEAQTAAPIRAAASSRTRTPADAGKRAPATPPPAPAGRQADPSRELLTLARSRLDMDQLVAPRGDSAVDYLREARSVARGSTEIGQIATSLAASLSRNIDAAIAAGELAAAEQTLASLQALAEEFELGPSAWSAAAGRLQQATAAARGAEIGDLLKLVDQRIESGRLSDPGGDDAVEHLISARTLDPGSAEVSTMALRLSEALHASAAEALANGDIDRAAATLEALIAIDAPEEGRIRLEAELEKLDRRAGYLQYPAAVSELVRTREVAPTYPIEALRDGTEGWVDVEFVVGADGVPVDLTIRAAEPARVFDKAALEAIGRWRFEPRMDAGEPVPQKVAVRLRFNLAT